MAKIIGKPNEGQDRSNAPTLDLSKSTEVTCENCGDVVFQSATIFRRIPKIVAGTQKDPIIPIEVFCCASCGELIQELLPPELREK